MEVTNTKPRREICICCGGEISPERGQLRGLTFYAFRRTIARNGVQVRLPPLVFAVFESLISTYPQTVRIGDIVDDVYGDVNDHDFESHRATIRVYVGKLRVALAPLGLDVCNVWSQGYRLAVLETVSVAA